MLSISAHSSAEILAIVDALRTADREWRKIIRQETRTVASKEWSDALQRHATGSRASTALASATLVRTGRVKASDQNVQLSSGTVGRRLSGGLNPKTDWAAVEFGANRDDFRQYSATSSRGARFTVRRRTKRGLPARAGSGHVVFPAAADVIPRIAALWAQTVARTIHEALESGR